MCAGVADSAAIADSGAVADCRPSQKEWNGEIPKSGREISVTHSGHAVIYQQPSYRTVYKLSTIKIN